MTWGGRESSFEYKRDGDGYRGVIRRDSAGFDSRARLPLASTLKGLPR